MFKFIFIFGRFCYACHCHHAGCPFRDTATLLHSCYFIRAAKPTDNTASTAMNFLLCYTDNFHYSLKTGTKVNVSLHILKNQSKKKRFVKIVYIYRTFTDKCNRNRLTTGIYTFNRQTATNTEKSVGHSIIAGRTSPIREKHPYDRTRSVRTPMTGRE